MGIADADEYIRRILVVREPWRGVLKVEAQIASRGALGRRKRRSFSRRLGLGRLLGGRHARPGEKISETETKAWPRSASHRTFFRRSTSRRTEPSSTRYRSAPSIMTKKG